MIDIDDVFARIRTSIQVGNGSDGTNNEGNLSIIGKNVLFDQWSAQVKHNLTVKNYSTLEIGDSESLDVTVAVRGCQVYLPEDLEDELTTTERAASDISVENGGTLKARNTKFLRWRNIYLGEEGDTGTTIELIEVKFDTCETVYYYANTLDMAGLIETYNNAGDDRNHCAEIFVTPDSVEDFLVHDCIEGPRFLSSLTFPNIRLQDINKSPGPNYDLGLRDGEEINLDDGIYDPDSVNWLAGSP